MIEPKLFTLDHLLATLLDDESGNVNMWRKQAEIIVGYMPPFPSPTTRPSCVVKFGSSFLRYSKGPAQGHMWDAYGDDYFNPSLALIALLQAPVPPSALSQETWDARNARLTVHR